VFVKEIEDALLRNEIDLAVHSSKDMPTLLPEGLAIAGVLPREDPHDAIVLPGALQGEAGTFKTLSEALAVLGDTPLLGTSSVRRIAQLRRVMRGARFAPIRGNLDTRLRKLDGGDYDAVVLAAAGLRRLGLASRISVTLPTSTCVPAPGQGIVAIETRDRDTDVRAIVSRIHDEESGAAFDAERALVESLGGGCQTPIGALAESLGSDGIELVATVVALDGSRAVRTVDRASRHEAAALGARVGARLIADGAGEILESVRQAPAAADARLAHSDD
jgi:hydroxymethylbilane synthase